MGGGVGGGEGVGSKGGEGGESGGQGGDGGGGEDRRAAVPSGQGKAATAPAGQYDPTVHLLHVVAPFASWYEPAGHAVHDS